jgi:hypothetical protein
VTLMSPVGDGTHFWQQKGKQCKCVSCIHRANHQNLPAQMSVLEYNGARGIAVWNREVDIDGGQHCARAGRGNGCLRRIEAVT